MGANQKDLNVLDEQYKGNVREELLPTEERIMDNISYLAAFLGGCVSIGTFTMGASLIGVLNLTQAILAMVIGCTVISVALVLTGRAGHKYGIPFTIQSRSAFGSQGVILPGLIRAVTAIIWFGFQSWVGAGAVNSSLKTLFGWDNLPLVFGLFIILQVLLSIGGFEGIKWLENIASVFIIATLFYMLYTVYNRYGVEIGETITNIDGTWGMPFWGGTTAFLGIYSTMIINGSDYSRELRRETKSLMTGSLYWLAILPVTLFMGLIGLMVSGATGNNDPVAVFSTTLGSPTLTVITLLFVAFAQVTTNVLNNVLPSAYVLMDTFKISYRRSIILVGILSIFTFPWLLVRPESARGLALFTQVYSAFLGPIFAVLVTDYYILRRENLNLNDYYNEEGPFKGINWAGIIAILIGSTSSLFFVEISWYVSLIPTAVSYYILSKNMEGAKRFRKGTIFE